MTDYLRAAFLSELENLEKLGAPGTPTAPKPVQPASPEKRISRVQSAPKEDPKLVRHYRKGKNWGPPSFKDLAKPYGGYRKPTPKGNAAVRAYEARRAQDAKNWREDAPWKNYSPNNMGVFVNKRGVPGY